MRGAFNRTLTVRYGTRSVVGPPLAVYGSDIPCRLVEQREVVQEQFPFDLTQSWVTLDSVDLHGPVTSSPWLGAVFTDILAADQVSFDGEPDVWFCVLRHEQVDPFFRDLYDRWLLLPLTSVVIPVWPPPVSPPPVPPPPTPVPVAPGDTCDTGSRLDGYGPWSVSNNFGELVGYYYLDLPTPGPWRLFSPSGGTAGWRVRVRVFSPGGDCCSTATPVQTIEDGGAECMSIHELVPGDGCRVCLRFDDPAGGVLSSSVSLQLYGGACVP